MCCISCTSKFNDNQTLVRSIIAGAQDANNQPLLRYGPIQENETELQLKSKKCSIPLPPNHIIAAIIIADGLLEIS